MILIPVHVSSSGMPPILGLMLCSSMLGALVFMWITMFQDRDKSVKIMSCFIFLPMIIGLLILLCGIIMEMLGA